MTCNSKLLLSLIVSGLQGKTPPLPETTDWELFFSESERQGVNGICADGLQLYAEKGIPVPGFNAPEIFTGKMSWLGNVIAREKQFAGYERAIRHLSELSDAIGIPMMILKGYGCSLNYPHKNHRVCGDIDIWCFGRQAEFDRQVQDKLKIRVSPGNAHHSDFTFEGFTVENHKEILDPGTHVENRGLNELLAFEAQQCRRNEEMQVILPSARFNGIHLLVHMASDFASTGTSLRRLLDWSTFVSSNRIDWDLVFKVADRYGMTPFLDSVNDICTRYLDYPKELFPVRNQDAALSDKVLEDFLKGPETVLKPGDTSPLNYAIRKSRSFIQNGWKHRMVYKDSLVSSFLKKSLNRFGSADEEKFWIKKN